jgi:hypothetical protein
VTPIGVTLAIRPEIAVYGVPGAGLEPANPFG